MPDTVLAIAVALLSPLLVGAPLTWILNGGRSLSRHSWLLAPFVGFAAIILPLQNLIYLNFPVGQTFWLVWAMAAVGWAVMLSTRPGRRSLRDVPAAVFALAGAVYLVQGAGLLKLGVDLYVGRAWSDQFNYCAMAEFFRTYPFDSTYEVAREQPWITILVGGYKNDRIGQSILQAFLMCSCGLPARPVFEPLALLGPALIVPVIALLAERQGLSRLQALAAAGLSGMMPASAYVHLEGFLSQSLAMPLLFICIVAIEDLLARPSALTCLRTALLVNTTISIYTDLTLIIVGLVVMGAVGTAVFRLATRRHVVGFAFVLASPFVLNSYFAVHNVLPVVMRTSGKVLAEVYPFAFNVAGWGRLWFGDLSVPGGPLTEVARPAVFLLFGLSYLGLAQALLCAWKSFREERSSERFSNMMRIASVSALAAIPMLVLIKDNEHPYQFFKLLLTVSPLLALGLSLIHADRVRFFPPLRTAAVTCCLLIAAWGTVRMVITAHRQGREDRSLAQLVHSPDLNRIKKHLEGAPATSVVIAENEYLARSWMTYYARKHEVRLANSAIVDLDLAKVPAMKPTLDLSSIAPGSLLVSSRLPAFAFADTGDLSPIDIAGTTQLWRVGGPNWVLPIHVNSENGIESLAGAPFFWVGDRPTTVKILTGSAGTLKLCAEILPGPSLPTTLERHLLVRTSAGDRMERLTTGGRCELTIPIRTCHETILIESGDAPVAWGPPGGETRTLLIGIKSLEMKFESAIGPSGSPRNEVVLNGGSR